MTMLRSWRNNTSPTTRKLVTTISVVFDYGIIFVLLLTSLLFISYRKPKQQSFSILDPTISFPYRPEDTIPMSTVYVLSFAVPAGVILLCCFLQSGPLTRRALIFNYSLIGLGTALACTVLITEILKWTVGRPRPEWLGRCQPDLTKIQGALSSTAVAMFDRSVCASTDQETLNDGQRSFPSGHASNSFAGLTYLTLFLSARFKLFIPKGHRHTHTFLVLVALAPMGVAGFVGATRVSDFRHRGSDVLAGSALGIAIALIVYRCWHPWVTDQSAAIPWDVLRMDEIEHRISEETVPKHEP